MAQEINEEKSKNLLKGIHIPPQPQIMVDLQMEILMPEVSMESLASIITKDIGISGSILTILSIHLNKTFTQ